MGFRLTTGRPSATVALRIAWSWNGLTTIGYVVFTNDLDFGAILAATRAAAPSVIQVRAQDVTPEHLSEIRQHEAILQRGALITIDESRLRSRIDGTASGDDKANALALDPSGDVLAAGSMRNVGTQDDLTVKLAGATGAELWRRDVDGTFDQEFSPPTRRPRSSRTPTAT
jgi:hypothetical protein